MKVRIAVLVGLLILIIGGMAFYKLWESHQAEDAKQALKEKGQITILTRNAPTTYYEGSDGRPRGLEFQLASDFANWVGVPAHFTRLETVSAILAELEKDKEAIAAAGLTLTPDRLEIFRGGPSYQEIRQLVVCNRRRKAPRDIAELSGTKLLITANSSYVEQLRAQQESHPELEWSTTGRLSTEQIFQKIVKQRSLCTVADSNLFELNRKFFPELEQKLYLSDEQPLGWLLNQKASGLQSLVKLWFADLKNSGRLQDYLDRYYGFRPKFDYYDIRVFQKRTKTRLPNYLPFFKKAGAATGFSWQLLAALSYQESHWDPQAESPFGAKGLMMLVSRTAASIGVTDRADPKQSIMGGAKYLKKMKNRLSEKINERDKNRFALAAYNVGFGHLSDAMTLTEELGNDPYQWSHVRETLPLLSNEDYYSKLPHGYARGTEPVRYVARVKYYQELIEHAERQKRKPPLSKQTE